MAPDERRGGQVRVALRRLGIRGERGAAGGGTVNIFLTFPGNAGDTRVFGGAPHDLQVALRQMGAAASCLDLTPTTVHGAKRYVWNLKEALLLRGVGGYQYTDCYLNDIWRNELRRLRSGVVINLFQLFHPKLFDITDLRKIFYIDQTLLQLYENYPYARRVSRHHRSASIAREKEQYQSADLTICMCQWAAESVMQDYGVANDRVAVVLPGGSVDLPDADEAPPENAIVEFNKACPLRFVFVGAEPVRKGLFRFLEALKTMSDECDLIRVTVIGPATACPAEYRDLSCVDWLGRIDRTIFAQTVRNHDMGILLSTGEATGRSLREFQMLGLGVLAPNVGGSPEMLAPGAGILVEKRDGPVEIASIIRSLLYDREKVARMRQAAWNARETMTWTATAARIFHLLKERRVA